MKLLITRAKAKEQLEERIAKISPLYTKVEADGAKFDQEFERFKNEIEKWRSYNTKLLLKIYDTPDNSTNYGEVIGSKSFIFDLNELDEYEQVYKPEISKEISFLESCIEELHLFSEPEGTSQIFDAGQTYDAFKALKQLVTDAQKEIFVIDAYVDEKTLDILSYKKNSVALKILTKKQSVTGAFKAACRTFSTQHGPLEIRTSETIHDRYIETDSSSLHQSGGSLKDLGKQVSTLIPLTDPEISKSIREILNKYWLAANPVSF